MYNYVHKTCQALYLSIFITMTKESMSILKLLKDKRKERGVHTSQTAQASVSQSSILFHVLKLLHVQTQLEQEKFCHWFKQNEQIKGVLLNLFKLLWNNGDQAPGTQPHHKRSPRPGSPWCSAEYGPCRTPVKCSTHARQKERKE